jgi:hypothetical protein
LTHSAAIVPDWCARLEAAGLACAEVLLDRSPKDVGLAGSWQLLSKAGLGGRQRWRWELPADDGGAPLVLYVKRYAGGGWQGLWDRVLRQAARGSRGRWEFEQSGRLRSAAIPAPPAVAFAEDMAGVLERRSVVILAAVPGDGLDRVWRAAVARGAPLTRGLARHGLAVRLGRFVSAFHQTGTCHRDLYLCHIFAELDESGQRPPRFTLIDLARTFRPRWRRARWIIKDLAQLDSSARLVGASRSDRLRALRAYLGLERGEARVRWYARRIVRKSDSILRREARHGRC